MILKLSKNENVNINKALKVWDFPETYLEAVLARNPQFPFESSWEISWQTITSEWLHTSDPG